MKTLFAIVATITVAASLASADPVGVVEESGKTAGHSVRDGALTFGRTTRDFFTHGPRTAKRTWRANAAKTRADAHHDAARVQSEAHSEH